MRTVCLVFACLLCLGVGCVLGITGEGEMVIEAKRSGGRKGRITHMVMLLELPCTMGSV